MQINESAKAFSLRFNINRLGGSVNTTVREAYMMDSAVFVWSAAKCLFSTLYWVKFEVERGEKGQLQTIEGNMTGREVRNRLQDDRYPVFFSIVKILFG